MMRSLSVGDLQKSFTSIASGALADPIVMSSIRKIFGGLSHNSSACAPIPCSNQVYLRLAFLDICSI